MLGPLQAETIQVLAAGRLLLFGVLGAGAAAAGSWWRPSRRLLLAGAAVGAILLLQVLVLSPAAAPWNRLRGDDLYVTASYQRVISDGVGKDFAYPDLPPHYPPLFFAAVGTLAGWLGWTGVGAAKLGAAVATALVPMVVGLWWSRRRRAGDEGLAPAFPLLLTLLAFVAVDYPSVLTKPYEFISAVVALLWFVVAHRSFAAPERVAWWWIALLGLVGAGLLTTYYLWLILAAIAGCLAAAQLGGRVGRRYLVRWAVVAGAALLASAWYWWPLLASYQRLGMENWLPAFFIPSDLNFFPTLEFTPRSAILWLGLAGLIAYRRRSAVRPALLLLAATYLWQVVSAVSIFVADAPFEAARGFTFLGEVILAYGAAYALANWLGAPAAAADGAAGAADHARRSATRWVVVWLGVALSLPFGLWLNEWDVQQRIQDLRVADGDLPPFVEYFARRPAESRLTTLVFLPKLNAVVALPLYVYHNQHASHPAANFTRRLEYLRGLGSARTPAEFAQRFAADNPYEPIEQVILYGVGEHYELYFWVDDYPNGGRELVVRWPRRLIAAPYFTPVPELSVGGFSAWRPAVVVRRRSP